MDQSIENENNCCGGPAPKEIGACCLKDAEEKQKGNIGCGCKETEVKSVKQSQCCVENR